MSGGFSFRYKVRLSWGSRLPFDAPEWPFLESDEHRLRFVSLKDDATLRDSEWVVLGGDNYESEATARESAAEGRHVVERAFAFLRLGADFGDHHRSGLRLADAFKKQLEEKVGGPVLPDHPGLSTFRSEPSPHFFGFAARGRADPATSEAERALRHPGAHVPAGPVDHQAHQFIGASVATALAGRSYDNRAPAEFFRRAYGLRSRVAHASARPVDRQDVLATIPDLESMVGDLLAGTAMLETADRGE